MRQNQARATDAGNIKKKNETDQERNKNIKKCARTCIYRKKAVPLHAFMCDTRIAKQENV